MDAILPTGETLSRHQTRIAAPPKRVWEALLNQDLGSSPLTKALLFLRGYGQRAFRASSGTFPEKLQRFGFTKLDEIPGRELVFGLAGRFWRWDGDLRPIPDRAAFLAFAEPGCVKAAWNLAVSDAEGTACVLSTETRIVYFGDTPRRRFRLYWRLIKPFSGVQRRAMLAGIGRAAEAPLSRT